MLAKLESKDDSKNTNTSIINPSLQEDIPPWSDPEEIDFKTAEGRTKWAEDACKFYPGVLPKEREKAANLEDATPAVLSDPKVKAILKGTDNYPKNIGQVHQLTKGKYVNT